MSKKIKLSNITPDDKNNNKHTSYGMDLLEKSVNKVGIIESITISNDDKIISGNARHEVIGKHFEKEALVIETDGTQPIIIKRTDIESDTKQFYEASILANTTSKKNIDFDMEVIDTLVEEFDIDVVDLGVDIIDEEHLEAEEDDFNGVPPKEPITVLGDLYEIGEHRLLCGDSTCSDSVERLMDSVKADMVFTSPPYNGNTSFNKGTGGSGFGGGKNLGKLYENYDDNLDSKEYIEFCQSVLNNCFFNTNGFIFWNINYNTNSRSEYLEQIYPYLEKLSETIIWKKQALPVPHGLTRTYEFIFVFSTLEKKIRLGHANKTEFNFWEVNNAGALDKSHRAAFPIELPSKAINLVEKTKIVLEPFAGSGTTMVASHQLKRKCYGMELDCKYCDVIVARMIKLDSTLPIKRNGVLLTNSEVLKFTENTSEAK